MLIPIVYEEWDQILDGTYQYYEAEFIEDFGVFRKGEKIEVLCISDNKCLIEASTIDNHNVYKSQKFKAIPIEN